MANSSPLVSADWLADHLGKGVIVFDIRSAVDGGGVAAYEAAHVPGATPQRDYGFILNFVASSADWRLSSSMTSFMVEEISGYANELADIQQKLMDLTGRCPKSFFEYPDGAGKMQFSLTPCPHPKRDPAGWDGLKCKLYP